MYGTHQPLDGLWFGPVCVVFGIAFAIAMVRKFRNARKDPRQGEPVRGGAVLGMLGIALGIVLIGVWLTSIGLAAR